MIKRFMHRPKYQRMLSHAEIVVGTPYADGLCSFVCMVLGPWERSSLPLKIREDPVRTFGAQLVKVSVKEVAVNHRASYHWLALATAKQAWPYARADGVLTRPASCQIPFSHSFKRAFDISIPHARPIKTCLGLRQGIARSSALPIGKDKMAPATAVELLPGALRLGEAVGDGVDHCRMMAEAAGAAIDLDVLGLGPVLGQAGLPGADAVGAAEEWGRRHERRLDQRVEHILVLDLAAAHHLVGAPGIGRFGRAGERTAQADQAAHPV